MTDQQDYNQRLIEEFRAARAAGHPMVGRPLLLLTTTGAKSGQPRTTPMMYLPADESADESAGARLLVIASNAGAPKHPAWYYNLLAHPQVTVEVGGETFAATAAVVEGAERDRVWQSIVARPLLRRPPGADGAPDSRDCAHPPRRLMLICC